MTSTGPVRRKRKQQTRTELTLFPVSGDLIVTTPVFLRSTKASGEKKGIKDKKHEECVNDRYSQEEIRKIQKERRKEEDYENIFSRTRWW